MIDAPKRQSWLERASVSVGILGTLITVVLTVWNARAKEEIDRRQAELSQRTMDLEAEIKRRSATIEESKERVERYKWVYGLVPALTEADPTRRNAALAMVRLALSTEEAQALLSGLQQSPNPEVVKAATQGFREIAAIADAEIARLVAQMNSPNADESKRATGRLERDYEDSSQAIGLVLDRLKPPNLATLSPSGFLNTLYYLARTNPKSWSTEQVQAADALLAAVRDRATGSQSKPELAALEAVVTKARR